MGGSSTQCVMGNSYDNILTYFNYKLGKNHQRENKIEEAEAELKKILNEISNIDISQNDQL